MTNEFSSQRAGNAENVPCHDVIIPIYVSARSWPMRGNDTYITYHLIGYNFTGVTLDNNHDETTKRRLLLSRCQSGIKYIALNNADTS